MVPMGSKKAPGLSQPLAGVAFAIGLMRDLTDARSTQVLNRRLKGVDKIIKRSAG